MDKQFHVIAINPEHQDAADAAEIIAHHYTVVKYAAYEKAWQEHVECINGDRFLAGRFPARFTEKDKQEFIQTLALIDMVSEREH